MKKLKNILQCNYIFYILLILSVLYVFINISYIDSKSKYTGKETKIYGYITDYKIDGDKLTITLKSKEKLIVNYYFKTKEEKDNYKLNIGNYILVEGKLEMPKDNTNFNLFNYKKYLLSQKIKYIFNAEKIKLICKNKNIFYTLKNNIINKINKCKKSSGYIKTFLLSDKNSIDYNEYLNYQKIGISHLLSVSGSHVTLISIMLLKILGKLKEINKYILISLVLFFYLFLTNFAISMLRAYLQFVLFSINKIFKFNIKNSNIVILLFCLMLFYNPYNIYNIGFIFSFVISFTLITFSKILNNKNFIYQNFIISLISFLVSVPIVINNFYNINLLSIIYNIFYVPYVTYLLFPICTITILFPFLDGICYFFINIFIFISNQLSNINILCFDIAKLNILLIIIYYLVLILILKQKKHGIVKMKNIMIFICLFVIFINYKSIVFSDKITFIDVGQGNSILIRIKGKNILIDTGGKIKYEKEKFRERSKEYNISDTLINYFKKDGVKK